ncbi:glycosyltransferase family 2 protein [bacterium]|nr:glycosyltransferase family 2 protein [bacterium]
MVQDPLVSVIIPVYNGASTLEKCLKAVFASSMTSFEVLVSDDASRDTSLEIARSFPLRVLESDDQSPSGAAAARNRAARVAIGRYLFFTDADVIIGTNTLEQVVDLFEREPDIQALIGSYTLETPVNNFSSRFKNYLHHYTHQHSAEQAITFWTACGSIRRDVFLKSGGFNENYEAASVEDIAFGYKLTKLGYRIRLVKEIQVTHLKEYTLTSMIRSDLFFRAIPWTRLMLREQTFRSDLNTSFSSAIGLLAAYLLLPLIVVALIAPRFWWIGGVFFLLFILSNLKLYTFIATRTKPLFFVRFGVMSYVYYLYSGLGLMIALAGYLCGRKY